MLTIGVAIFIDVIYIDTLFSMNLLLSHFPDENILRFARVASAVDTAKAGLSKYYAELSKPQPVARYPFFPNPTSIKDDIPTLRYTGKFDKLGGLVQDLLDPKLRSSAIFSAVLDVEDSSQVVEERKVVVKFAPTYCSEAHEILADAHLAPKLHVCTKLKGGLWMVVMDQVEGKRVAEMLLTEERPIEIYNQAKEAVELLHQKDLVFGDLRPTNMLYRDESKQLQLVDFDMAGKHEIARYPATLNRSDLWPRSMMRGGPLSKQHDEEWLVILKRLLESGY